MKLQGVCKRICFVKRSILLCQKSAWSCGVSCIQYHNLGYGDLTLFYMGGGSTNPPLQFLDRGSSSDGSNELIFLDFVPFNNPQDLAKPFFRFFFQIFEKFCLEDTWSPKILTRNSQKSKKKSIFSRKILLFLPESEFYMFSAFFWGT